MSDERLEFEVIRDYGAFGDGKWQKHLTYMRWGNNPPKYDIRPWNEDMTKCGKGITLDDGEMYDLMSLLEEAMEGED